MAKKIAKKNKTPKRVVKKKAQLRETKPKLNKKKSINKTISDSSEKQSDSPVDLELVDIVVFSEYDFEDPFDPNENKD